MKRQRGMAVIMALLIVALATTAAAMVMWQQGLWWHQLDNDKSRAQLRQVADGGLGWAMEILRFNNSTSNVVALSQLWAQPLPQTEAQGVKVSGQMQDLQGRFNLNALVRNGQTDARQLVLYKRLLSTLGLPTRLSEPLLKQLRGGRAEDDKPADDKPADGAQANKPRQPDHPILRVEMLRYLDGYTPEALDKLLPNVAALPAGANRINVNTATPALLKALMPALGDGNLQVLVTQRKTNYFKDAGDFKARVPQAATLDEELIFTGSNYFLLDSQARYGHARLNMQALIYSNMNVVKLVWRQDGNGATRRAENNDDDAKTLSASGLAG